MSKFSFVVLHYNHFRATEECVNSLIKLNPFKIIIVDNGSKNRDGVTFKKIYKDFRCIDIVTNKTNQGYARGFNQGYQHAKVLNSDFIMFLNNDTTIEQKDFIDIIEEEYNKRKFDIAGPDIISGLEHQNPFKSRYRKPWRMRMGILLWWIEDKTNCSIVADVFDIIRQSIKFFHKKRKVAKDDLDNVSLHGAAIIFSKYFIDNFEGLYGGTFLYFEEIILDYFVKLYALKTSYINKAKVYHTGSLETKNTTGDEKQRRSTKHKYMLESGIEYLKIRRNKWALD